MQKYILTTSDFAKGMLTDINNYEKSDRINNTSFIQILDPIKENILRRQNPLELVLEGITTFDAENQIVGSLLKELYNGKKLLAGDLVKKGSGPPGVDFAHINRLNRLKERKTILLHHDQHHRYNHHQRNPFYLHHHHCHLFFSICYCH